VSEFGIVMVGVATVGTAVLVAIDLMQLWVVIAGSRALSAAARRHAPAEDDAAMASPLTPPVSLIVPWTGSDTIERLSAIQSLRYPDVEIIVVSSDAEETARLRSGFGLVEIPVVLPADLPSRVEVTKVAVPPDGTGLVVVEVRGPASQSDLLNVGVVLARSGLICVLDPRIVLADDTLLRLARPFRDRPRDTLAATAVARPADAAIVRQDLVVGRRWPIGWRDRLRLVGQLRSAVLRHAGGLDNRAMTEAGGLLLIRREQAREIGGFRPRYGGEDDDLRLRAVLAQRMSASRSRRVAAVAGPVCWRTPGERGRDVPKPPGRKTAIGGPVFVIALVLAAGAAVAGIALGEVGWPLLGLVGVVGILVPATLSLAAIVVDDLTFPKAGPVGDVLAAAGAALIEPFRSGGAPTYQ
jgi:hypothetical protein